MCVKKLLKVATNRRNGAVHVTLQLNYSTITLSSEKIHSEKQNNFVIYLFILAKVAAKWQLLTATSPDTLVANATVLDAISSPGVASFFPNEHSKIKIFLTIFQWSVFCNLLFCQKIAQEA